MPKITYIHKNFSPDKLKFIKWLDAICANYADRGFDLTLRQLYYVCVSRNVISNNDAEYDRLGVLVSDARLAGLMDWNHIVDRTRYMRENEHWDKPSSMIRNAVLTYLNDKWATQPNYVEVWVEKDALVGVVGPICSRLDVPFFSCRGYTSQSEMWGAGQRLIQKVEKGKKVHIIHLGDHDPSGMDMSQDILRRLRMFVAPHEIKVLRAALNMNQIRTYKPPPNPTKPSDSRSKKYVTEYGSSCWELDALTPETLTDVIRRAVALYRDEALWKEALENEKRGRTTLKVLYDRFAEVLKFLRPPEPVRK